MFRELMWLGLFDGDPSDIYNQNITLEKFKQNEEAILNDLKGGKNQELATKAVAEIASDYPEFVTQNGKHIHSLLGSQNPAIEINAMIALTNADFVTGGGFVGKDTVMVLNEMLEHDDSKVRESASELLMMGARDFGYSVQGSKVASALRSNDSVLMRLRAAQALRFYVSQTGNHDEVGPCGDAIKENFEPAYENLDNEYCYELSKELIRLTRYLMMVNEDVTEDIPFIVNKYMQTRDGDLITVVMELVQDLPLADKDAFLEIEEPFVRPMLADDAGEAFGAYAVSAYKKYSAHDDADMDKMEELVEPVFDYYKNLESGKFQDVPRDFCAVFLRNLNERGVNIEDVLKGVGVFERELEQRETADGVLSVLELYLATIDKVGTEHIVKHVKPVESLLDSDNRRIRETSATVLMSLVNNDESVLESNELNMNKVRRILDNTESEFEDVDRVHESLSNNGEDGLGSEQDTESSEDMEHEYLTKSPSTDFDDYIGMSELKEEAHRKIVEPLKEPELHEEFGVDIQRGFLFHGPPGTGKTYFAKSLAGEYNLSYMEIDAADLVTKWIGEGAKNVAEMFDVAVENEPCLIFIDEIDAIASDRSDVQQVKSERQMVNQLLQSVSRMNDEEHEVVVIGATNRIDDVDSAVLRSGRLGTKIEFTEPDAQTRIGVFRHHCKPDTSDVSDEWLSKETEGMVQSDLTELASQSSYNALERYKEESSEKKIIEADVEAALEKIHKEVMDKSG